MGSDLHITDSGNIQRTHFRLDGGIMKTATYLAIATAPIWMVVLWVVWFTGAYTEFAMALGFVAFAIFCQWAAHKVGGM